MSYQKVALSQVRATIRNNGQWAGFIVGNHVNPAPFYAGGHPGFAVEFTSLAYLARAIFNFTFCLSCQFGDQAVFFELSPPEKGLKGRH